MRKLVALALAAFTVHWLAERSRARRHAEETPQARPEPITRWEGEGGNTAVRRPTPDGPSMSGL
jgi:hypothetical protein